MIKTIDVRAQVLHDGEIRFACSLDFGPTNDLIRGVKGGLEVFERILALRGRRRADAHPRRRPRHPGERHG